MGGLRNICKLYGAITINGQQWVYDYKADEPVRATDMKVGSDRWKASERAKYETMCKLDYRIPPIS